MIPTFVPSQFSGEERPELKCGEMRAKIVGDPLG